MTLNESQLIEYIHEHLSYHRDRGEFVWVKPYHKSRIGTLAGCIDGDGYRVIEIKKRKYRAHHLVWLMEHGELPDYLDHDNRVRDDNRIENLNPSDPYHNQQNRVEQVKNGMKLTETDERGKRVIREDAKKIINAQARRNYWRRKGLTPPTGSDIV